MPNEQVYSKQEYNQGKSDNLSKVPVQENMQRLTGSFRDRSGYVFEQAGKIIRTINEPYKEHWEHLLTSGLLQKLKEMKLIVSFAELKPASTSWKTLQMRRVPCISYPYEWSFSQLKAAALLTLRVQTLALKHGMTLKDASAYNIQFIGSKPLFIDLLSFEKRKENEPWQAYRQFCMHFLAPLALASAEPRLGKLATLWIDGIPLDIAWALIPFKHKALSAGLQMHLHLHAITEKKYSDARTVSSSVKTTVVSTQGLLDITASLAKCVKKLPGPSKPGEWTDYYTDTNYSSIADEAKLDIVRQTALAFSGNLALDLGANTGKFSRVLANYFEQVIAADLDPQAVDLLFQRLQKEGNNTILPLIIDLANPSPAIGWSCAERDAFVGRWQANLVCALALTHHLFFTVGIPWDLQADFFAKLLQQGGGLLMEFVPKEDSQVQRMLAARDDVFEDYNLETCLTAFKKHFELQSSTAVIDSKRTIVTFVKK